MIRLHRWSLIRQGNFHSDQQISDIDYPNAKDLDQYLNKTGVRLAYDSTFQTEISFNRSVVHVPTDVFDGGWF